MVKLCVVIYIILIDFIDFRARRITRTRRRSTSKVTHIRHTTRHSTRHTRHSTGHTARSTASSAICRGNNRSPHILQLFLLRFIFFALRILIGIHPIQRLLHHILHFLLIVVLDNILKLGVVQRIAHLIRHILQLVLGLNRLALLLVLRFVLLRVRHNLVNLLLRQSTFVAVNRDLRRDGRILLVLGSHRQNTIRVQIEGNLNLWHTARRRRDAHQLKLAQQVIVLRQLSLALVHLNQHARLIVGISRKRLIRFARNRLVALDEFGHHTAGSLDTQRQWRHIQQQQIASLAHLVTTQNRRLNGCTIRDSLVRVDRFARIASIEIFLNHLLNFRDTRGSAHQHHLVNVRLAHLCVLQYLRHRLQTLAEIMRAQILESSTRNRRRKINAIVQGIHLDIGTRSRR
mmetsp:Transcript_44578/g.73788  ORF Transcript_44578/g.73788 Transcript_44578/m.73788 type:complete len:402 (-) Transcript_44578:1000-2205(-)